MDSSYSLLNDLDTLSSLAVMHAKMASRSGALLKKKNARLNVLASHKIVPKSRLASELPLLYYVRQTDSSSAFIQF